MGAKTVGCARYRVAMLRSVEPITAPDSLLAYPVPFRFDRRHAPRLVLHNASLERLSAVTFALIGAGSMPVQAPITLVCLWQR